MPFATKGRDSRRVYFEDDGGDGAPVVFHGGQLDAVADLRESALAHALPNSEFRLVYVDHRGLGTSDKPHDPEAYRMPLRVADAVAVLDQLGIHRAHFIGQSWGGRLGFGIGEHIVVGVPWAAIAAGWLLSGREPPAIARPAIE
jgi:pimeloyl-ACP methyl ester carboxylesterase